MTSSRVPGHAHAGQAGQAGQAGACCTGPSRRAFLGAAVAGTAVAFGSTLVTTAPLALAAPPRAASVLVLLSLRGAADGLSLVVPHGDPVYAQARPRIAVPTSRLLCRDDMFGLHPALAPLVPLWQAGALAAVHASGLPAPNRSHFAAMEEIEDAAPGSTARIGWLNRMIGETATTDALEALSIGSSIPTSLVGPEPAMSMRGLSDAAISGTSEDGARTRALHVAWDAEPGPMGDAFRRAMAATTDLESARAQADRTSTYPSTDLGRAMSSVARTLRADLGVTTVTVDSGDWDMHTEMGNADSGQLRTNAADLAGSIAAFFDDLGAVRNRVTLVTLSEFGRRVQENSARGTDHGWGNVMFVAGAGVNGGRYYGRWPGLENKLDADVQVTTDYRSVLSEVVTRRLGASSAVVFPGFAPQSLGLVRST